MEETGPKDRFEDLNLRLLEATAALGSRLESSICILSAVRRLASIPVSAQDMEHGASLILGTILGELSDVNSCSLMLFDEQTGFLNLLAGQGQADFLGEVEGPYNKDLKFRPGEGIAGRVFQDRQARYYDKEALERKFIRPKDELAVPNSLACLPLISQKECLGVVNITFTQDKEFDYPRQRDLFLLSEVIANTIRTYILKNEVAEAAALLGEKARRSEDEINTRKLVEEEKRNLEKQLRESQKLEAIGTLSGGVAHEFNNFLQAIVGFSHLMLAQGMVTEEGRKYLLQIDGIVDKASSLIRGLLAFSRKLEPKLKPTAPEAVIAEARKIIQAAIPRMIRVETSIPEGLPMIRGDINQLEQILLNLATNARDAMPQGGRIRIAAQKDCLDRAFCENHIGPSPGDHVRLDVSDNGKGIPSEIRGRIFEPFFTSKEVGKGTGLGLAVVYGIVKSHRGCITCESEPGAGTTFRIWLPVCDERRGRVDSGAPGPEDLSGKGETVLVVDDVEAILEVTRTTLSANGYRIFSALEGESALKILRSHKGLIDLVLLDLIMPGMGGRECLVEMLKIDPGIRVIVASGMSSRQKRTELSELGAVGFLGKPYRPLNLLSLVRRVLDGEGEKG